MAEETVMVHQIGTIFLAGPPLVKAATGEEVTPEDLGGARIHAEVSGCVDHFALREKEAYDCTRNIVSTLNFQLPEEEEEDEEQTRRRKAEQEPLYNPVELLGLAPESYNHSLDVKMVVSRLTDGGRFQEFKARYGTTLTTGFAKIHGTQHPQQLQQSPPHRYKLPAEVNSNHLKAQGAMMSAVACASVPKITVVIGGCHGADSYAMCGRAFDPHFLFLWPNAKVSITAPGHAGSLLPADGEREEEEKQEQELNMRLKKESSAFYSSGRLWDDGVILPQDTRRVKEQPIATKLSRRDLGWTRMHDSGDKKC
ncbi:Methylcrotonoyl-CoA carboxylase beta chain, mitochondrial [Liparis tanakae]|uniref:methylcrotonoyl-CoA carboxylase n=1 Tax=Liparis tanakae TaxID=230148 RepID=A0A4Z2EL90_9TELE|nr:Methylcrotonoyl-CoA carboxylase beta chain, mitochondrial [Liparis tanakae]